MTQHPPQLKVLPKLTPKPRKKSITEQDFHEFLVHMEQQGWCIKFECFRGWNCDIRWGGKLPKNLYITGHSSWGHKTPIHALRVAHKEVMGNLRRYYEQYPQEQQTAKPELKVL